MVVVRFAPSPTGRLHVGNARIALVNFLFAKSLGGSFLLRLDDTDRARSSAELAEGIRTDLRWLGLKWDGEASQSQRIEHYNTATERLKAAGRLYPCYETQEELEGKRRRQLSRGMPPVYDRAALNLNEAERNKFEAAGRKPHWRFLLEAGDVAWNDLVGGPSHAGAEHLSDPVLIRGDGSYLYTLPSVVDDIAMAVTHVIRGADHITNTAPQIQLFRALGAEPPKFAHLTLLADAGGQGLSKRTGSLSLAELREEGVEAMAILSLLAKLGTSESVVARTSIDQLIAEFDIARFGRGGSPRFDIVELQQMNLHVLHSLSFQQILPRLKALGFEPDETFWLAVRPNLRRLEESRDWWRICREKVTPQIQDEAFLRRAAEMLPPEPWTNDTARDWAKAVQSATGRSGKNLFHPLRMALTGRGDGPDLQTLLPLIGRARVTARLLGMNA